MAKKVLVTEKVAEECITILKEKGLEVDISLKTPPEELLRIIPGYDALVVRSATKVTREVIEAGSVRASASTTSTSPPPLSAVSSSAMLRPPTSFPPPSMRSRSCLPLPATFPKRTPS